MKNVLIAILLLAFPACSSVSPDAGFEAVLIDKPILFGHGGVRSDVVSTGQKWVLWTTENVMVSVLPVQYQLHFDDLMSSDGVPLDFDAILRLRVKDSYKLISQFGPQWYETNVEREFANRVRQAVRKHGMNETAISTSAIEEIDAEVSKSMEEYIVSAKLPIELIQVTVGKANPPDSIKSQRIETAAQQQRVLTEQQRKLAEDARKAAERSRADSDNAYRNEMQLSPEQFIRLETVKMQREVCSKSPCTFVIGSTPPLVIK